jgi:hypothetical protein
MSDVAVLTALWQGGAWRASRAVVVAKLVTAEISAPNVLIQR